MLIGEPLYKNFRHKKKNLLQIRINVLRQLLGTIQMPGTLAQGETGAGFTPFGVAGQRVSGLLQGDADGNFGAVALDHQVDAGRSDQLAQRFQPPTLVVQSDAVQAGYNVARLDAVVSQD